MSEHNGTDDECEEPIDDETIFAANCVYCGAEAGEPHGVRCLTLRAFTPQDRTPILLTSERMIPLDEVEARLGLPPLPEGATHWRFFTQQGTEMEVKDGRFVAKDTVIGRK